MIHAKIQIFRLFHHLSKTHINTYQAMFYLYKKQFESNKKTNNKISPEFIIHLRVCLKSAIHKIYETQ